MPIDKRIGSAAEAVADTRDGATVLISGFGGAGFANTLIRALREQGARELTLVVNSATHPYSLTHELIDNGQVRKVVCSAARGRGNELSAFEKLMKAGKIVLECLPQGTFAESIRAGGAGIPAYYTPVGVGTDLTRGKEVRRFGDRDYVLEPAIKGDLALIRADLSDLYGNLVFRYAQMNFGAAMATAARVTVAEVREVTTAPLAHDRIQLSGVYVDRVVVGPATGGKA
jgi:3-oxoadipate CoA-transferase alpha subunit